MIARRPLLVFVLALYLGAASAASYSPPPAQQAAPANVPFDLAPLKKNWRARIEAIRAAQVLPIIDIESSYNAGKFSAPRLAEAMDNAGVALIAFSVDVGKDDFEKGKFWSDHARTLVALDPWRYIPTTNGGVHPAWTEKPEVFLDETIAHAKAERYPLLGEFEFRHYPSPRQWKREEMYRDVSIPINGALGRRLFAFAEQSGIPFQIHYEIEDDLLPAFEEMLKRYPRAKVIWCHLAQIRYQRRSSVYGPAYVRRLLQTYPNLYFDVAFGHAASVYPGSGERHARVWDRERGGVKQEWVELIADHPWRFLAALDLGGDRMDELPEKTQQLRHFLDALPAPARAIVAYKAAWKLLFDEEI